MNDNGECLYCPQYVSEDFNTGQQFQQFKQAKNVFLIPYPRNPTVLELMS